MDAAELARAMLEAKGELDAAVLEHRTRVIEAAEADRVYRIAKATSILATTGTVQEREARMDKATADDRFKAHVAAGLEVSALEAIRSKRQILSALQSLAAAQREEAHLARYESRELESA